MRVLTADSYPMNFNLPAEIRNSAVRVRFRNLGRLWTPADALAVYWPRGNYDILHLMNKIPLAAGKPWVVTFESALPRMFSGPEPLKRLLREQLLRRDCLGLIAMSEWAKVMFQHLNAGWAHLPESLAKLSVIHPTVAPQQNAPKRLTPGEPIQILFVGNNFARKGGVVALRLARKALSAGLPVRIHIASAMNYSRGAHADHPDPKRYEEDLRGMELPNVTFHGALANDRVLGLMQKSHVQLLATLHDTYGFSVIEGFSVGLPAITSNVCALPELVRQGENGFVLELPTDERNRWSYLPQVERHSEDSWTILDEAYQSLTNQAFAAIANLAEHPDRLERLSQGSIDSATARHNPDLATVELKRIYSRRPS